MGNREAKELRCTTHGHELREGMLVGGRYRVEGRKGEEKKWDDCNSIVNTIYFKIIKNKSNH